ncbi:MAG: alpha/beta hydrolase [Candidatus Competibacteraceae bacterium]|nr:alpha/beta hydrolase [Candidatus Competibacteraceae bacterium]
MSTLALRVIALLLAAVFGLAGCSPVTVLNGLTAETGYVQHPTLPYANGPRHALDLYQPLGCTDPAPVVVFFYGGSWRSGERAEYRFAAAALAQQGLLVIVPDYRLYPEVTYPAFLQDAARAVVWTFQNAANYGGDPGRIYVMGHSAGAYLAAMLAYDARWLAAEQHSPQALAGFIGLAGPYSFLPIEDPEVQPIFHWPKTAPETQPLMHVTAHAPRTLLISPEHDPVVNPERNSVALAAALQRAGVAVTLKRYEALNHATTLGALAWPLRGLAPVLDDITAFIAAVP